MDIQEPITIEHDGWTVQSNSVLDGRGTTAEALKASMGEETGPETPTPRITPPPTAPDPPAETAETPEQPEEADADEAPPPVVAKPEPPKDRRPAQARIDEQTRKFRDQERIAEAERKRADALEARLRDIESRPAPKPESVAPAAPPVATATEKPTWAQYEQDGKTWEQYQDDRDAWRDAEADRKIAAADAARDAKARETESRTEQERQLQTHLAKIEVTRKAHPDLDVLVQQNLQDLKAPYLNHLILISEHGGDILYHLASHPDEAVTLAGLTPTRPVVDAIRESDCAPELLSHFAQHPDEFARINALPPSRALTSIGRLEMQLTDAPTPGPSPTAPKPVSRAAAPTRPVAPAPITGSGGKPTAVIDRDFGPEYVTGMNRAEAEAAKRRSL